MLLRRKRAVVGEEIIITPIVEKKIGRGRPKGSKNKIKSPVLPIVEQPVEVEKKRRGRKKGSKNKVKDSLFQLQDVSVNSTLIENTPIIDTIDYIIPRMDDGNKKYWGHECDRRGMSMRQVLARYLNSYFGLKLDINKFI